MSTPFRFKQFSVSQDRCAMKVNTDGVLLGAWAEVSGARNLLDIGTGTGVIALMMAQRNPEAIVDAIEIDADAFKQASENFLDSLWRERLYAYHSSLQNFKPEKKYDLIISNPPYFVDDYKTENHQKNIAKHSVSLSYEELISGIHRLLSDSGEAFLVLPAFNLQSVEAYASEKQLFITKVMEVCAVEGKAPYLALIRLNREQRDYSKSTIVIQNEASLFTNEYKSLTKEFYLKF